MAKPLVSICLPNLNTRPFLDERMESILSQTFTDWELVISDNYSDDGSWEFFQKFKDDPRIHLLQAPRRGMYANWNECLSRAVGEYVYIATSDDSMKPELLEKLVPLLEARKDVDLAVCGYDKTDVDGKILSEVEHPDLERFLEDSLKTPHRRESKTEFLTMICLGCHWNTLPAVVIRRSLFEKTGQFRTDCMSYADTPWRIKAILNSDLIYIPDKLATWRQHEKQATVNLPTNREELVFKARRQAVTECDNLIPHHWKRDHDYMEKILFQAKCRYFVEYHLHRTAFKWRTKSFMTGCLQAMVKEPRYFMSRLMCGFSWNTPQFGDKVEYLKDLMDRWEVKWPPEPL